MIATGNHCYYKFAARSTTGMAIRSPKCFRCHGKAVTEGEKKVVYFHLFRANSEYFRSLPQSAALTAPSDEGGQGTFSTN